MRAGENSTFFILILSRCKSSFFLFGELEKEKSRTKLGQQKIRLCSPEVLLISVSVVYYG